MQPPSCLPPQPSEGSLLIPARCGGGTGFSVLANEPICACTGTPVLPCTRGLCLWCGCRCKGLHSLFSGLSTSCYLRRENSSSLRELVVQRGGKPFLFLQERALSMGICPGFFDACSLQRKRPGCRRLLADAAVPCQQPHTFLFRPSKISSSWKDAEPSPRLLQRSCCSSLSVAAPHPCVPAAAWVAGPSVLLCVSKVFCERVSVP